jgi:hypothetical protein
MAVIAEAYDTAAVQTAARGAVRSPSAMPRLPYRCYGTRRARRGALSVATGNVRVYFTALSFSRRVVVTLKQWPLPCEARQMVINLRGRSADASRIVWARVADLRRNSYSVRYSLLVRRRHSVKIMWQSLEFRPDTK